jgi:hypothetical protein
MNTNTVTISWSKIPTPFTWTSSTYSYSNYDKYKDKIQKYYDLLPIGKRWRLGFTGSVIDCAGVSEENKLIALNIVGLLKIQNRLMTSVKRTQEQLLNNNEKRTLNEIIKNEELFLLFVLLHEVGHIVLKHSDSPMYLYDDEYRTHYIERQADIFAIKSITKYKNSFKNNIHITQNNFVKLKNKIDNIK